MHTSLCLDGAAWHRLAWSTYWLLTDYNAVASYPVESIMWKVLRELGWLAAIPSWVSAVAFWREVVGMHWLAAPISITFLTVWATLAVQRVWRQGVLQRWYRATLDHASAVDIGSVLGLRPPIDRALYVRGFIRMPEGEEPPDPMFKGTRTGANVQRPWRPYVPKTVGNLWVATSFAFPDPSSGVCVAMPAEKGKTRGEQYSVDGEQWRGGNRLPDDRLMRYREPTHEPSIGDLSDPIVLGTRASNRCSKLEWLRLISTVIRYGDTKRVAVPPMRLSPIKELREVLQSYGAKFDTAEATVSSIGQLTPIRADSRAEMTRLVCTFHEHDQSNVLEAVVRSPIYDHQHDGLRFAIDFVGDPDSGVVDAVRVEGAIPASGSRYHDIATVFFR